MKNFDPQYNDLTEARRSCHLEGAMHTRTLIEAGAASEQDS